MLDFPIKCPFGSLSKKNCKYVPISFLISVPLPHVTARELLKQHVSNFMSRSFTRMCWQIPVSVKIEQKLRANYINFYKGFCSHLLRILINIYRMDECFQRNLQIKQKPTFYAQHIFRISLAVFETSKRMRANMLELLRLLIFLNLLTRLIFNIYIHFIA
jgi:hypothetical protein